jgi:acyl carrier protein
MSTTEIPVIEGDATLRERVRAVMASTFVVDVTELPSDATQETCERWTSLYHMMLLVVIEEQFGVTLTLDEMTSMTSESAIISVLKNHGVDA